MTSEETKRAGRSGRVIRLAALIALFLLVLFETLGFPDFATAALTRKLSQSSFLVEAEGMRLDLLTGLYFKDVTVYRKKVVGPPAVDCGGMRVRWNPMSLFREKDNCFSVEFVDGVIRSRQATHQESTPGSQVSCFQVLLTDIEVDDIALDRLSAEVLTLESKTIATNIVCSVGGDYGKGTASGWIVFEGDGSMGGRVVSEFDPHVLLPFLKRINWAYTCKLIDRFNWAADAPLVDTSFSKKGNDELAEFQCKSIFSMADYTYRGVGNDACDGMLSVSYTPTSGVVSVDNISISIDSGAIAGGFLFDDKNDLVRYRAACDVNPKDFFQMVGLFEREDLASWSFPGVTKFISEGKVDLKKEDGDSTRVAAEVESTGMGVGLLMADTCIFTVNMLGSTCRVSNIHGSIWDGHFKADSEVVFREDSDLARFDCQFDDCDFSKVVSSVSKKPTEMSGKFSADLKGSFLISSNMLDTMNAAGRFSVDDGKVYQLPVFGGLTKILAKIIPGLDFVISQSDMTADLNVADGKIVSEKVSIDGDVLSMSAKGSTSFAGQLDYAVQLKLMSEHSVVAKVLRTITWPISKLLEFRLKGTPDNPEWYPINFSSELLERVGLKKSNKESK